MNLDTLASGGCTILYDAARVTNPVALPFDHRVADEAEPVVGEGRGGVWRVLVDGQPMALRQYRRGGMVRHILHTAYLWTGLESTRAFREFRLLAALHAEGLPVPAPVATRVVRTLGWYRAELLTIWIPGARSLVARLSEQEQPATVWAAVGHTLRRLHAAGVDHADLNAHNILVDEVGAAFVVDLDRGRRRRGGRRWRRANLARLRRSLEKVHATGRALYFTESGWTALLSAYRDPADPASS
jgi:3-deoxy-D-manno-octulosonic acid kinase